ncbi:hypothetical protein BDZ94DRAFT_233721 [Collybia nuda]|uniref:LysM domain-containing protein n=1 Tax=Collybia nuda TaxID=64659 RepID=A0A9P6CCS1_9AGAR|nr:hypothetical protein BDZ94DRAFT_233721 [Collybia nuda]
MFARAQLIVLAVAGVYLANANPLKARADPVCARTYTVVAGDTCDKISASEGVSTYQLATANAGVINAACDNLWVDQVICLALEGKDCSPVHVVVAGDSCDAIADAAGTTSATLLANNPNVDADCANIYPDEVLCVSPTVV